MKVIVIQLGQKRFSVDGGMLCKMFTFVRGFFRSLFSHLQHPEDKQHYYPVIVSETRVFRSLRL